MTNSRDEAVRVGAEAQRDGHLWARVPAHGPLRGWQCVRCYYVAKPYDEEPTWPPCPVRVSFEAGEEVNER